MSHHHPDIITTLVITGMLLVCLYLKGYGQNTQPGREVLIQPLGGISAEVVDQVRRKVAAIIPAVELKPAKPLPRSAWYPPRGRYRADSLVDILSRSTPAGCVTLGLTAVDISCTKGEYTDWGVFGMSECPGKACVASSYRSGKNNPEGLFETAIHELGHAMGLDHYPDLKCLMQDAKGRSIRASAFCQKCKAYLRAHGWNL